MWGTKERSRPMTFMQLSDRKVIRVTGTDASKFLQGLLSAEIDEVTPDTPRTAALLTPQGKILFDMLIFKKGGAYFLDCSAVAADDLAERLSFYRLRVNVDIILAPECHAVWSPISEHNTADLAVDPRLAQLGNRGISDILPQDDGTNTYHQTRIHAGIAEAYVDYAPNIIFPHQANLDLLAGVSFTKGCFIGQEVVSRIHHRSSVKKRFLPCDVIGDVPPSSTEIKVGARKIGHTGSSSGNEILALLHLDQIKTRLDGDKPIKCLQSSLTPRFPDWLVTALTKEGHKPS
jgi:folate-binding protein YgfZ